MKMFTINGPHEVPHHIGATGAKLVRSEDGRSFFNSHPSFSKRRGCYVFAVRAGGGIKPLYVGKTWRSFKSECFGSHQLNAYNQGLADCLRGTPVMFLVSIPETPGPVNRAAIRELEDFLIQTAVGVNENLLNVQGTGQSQWGIKGVIRSRQGKPSKSAKNFKMMMKL